MSFFVVVITDRFMLCRLGSVSHTSRVYAYIVSGTCTRAVCVCVCVCGVCVWAGMRGVVMDFLQFSIPCGAIRVILKVNKAAATERERERENSNSKTNTQG